MPDIQWQEPPAKKTGAKRSVCTDELLSALDSRPGEWALTHPAAGSSARNATSRYCKRHPEYETTTRVASREPLRFDIYMRRRAA